MNTQINRLPVPTWNRTGVNWLDKKALPPDIEYSQGDHLPYDGGLPHGISLMDRIPEEIAAIPSGMGEWMDEFILSRADKTCYLLGEGSPVILLLSPILWILPIRLSEPIIL